MRKNDTTKQTIPSHVKNIVITFELFDVNVNETIAK